MPVEPVHPVAQMLSLISLVMNVGEWAGVNISFPKHTSATVRNILMVLGRFIEPDNAECCV